MEDAFLFCGIVILLFWIGYSFYSRYVRDYRRFPYLFEEKILAVVPKIRRRVYYQGRYELRAIEEKLGIVVTNQRLLFARRGCIYQVIDFRSEPTTVYFPGPYFFILPEKILFQSKNYDPPRLSCSFLSLDRMVSFELFDLPWEIVAPLFVNKETTLK